MYLCQELSAAKLREIADYFNLNHAGSFSFITHQTRQQKREDKGFHHTVESLVKSLLNQATLPLLSSYKKLRLLNEL